MMDEFLDNYEVLGRKLLPKLEGDTGAEKLDTLRRAMAEAGPVNLDAPLDEKQPDILMPVDIDDIQDRWDCETILSEHYDRYPLRSCMLMLLRHLATYTNLENHPRIIRARDSRPVPKIKLDPRTGLPSVQEEPQKSQPPKVRFANITSSATEESDEEDTRRLCFTYPTNYNLY
jgi:protein LTV1